MERSLWDQRVFVMTAYYNEFDPKAAAWLRQLIKNGNIANGFVDERSIIEVTPEDLEGYTQCHFFAGIGVWSHSLRKAGWKDNQHVWTASLPCQPFSVAGNQKGKEDERHLLPHFIELVKQCKPDAIFGEQVESAIKHQWLDDLQTNMEAENYAVGHCVLGAHSVNAAHIRQRLYWVAAKSRMGNTEDGNGRPKSQLTSSTCRKTWDQLGRPEPDSRMADSLSSRSQRGISGWENTQREDLNGHIGCSSTDSNSRMGNTEHDGQPSGEIEGSNGASILSSEERKNSTCEPERTSTPRVVSSDSNIEWLYCRDNKYRPIKSGIKPLVDGFARGVVHISDSIITPNDTSEARVQRLKGYGNAIVAGTAQIFIESYMETKL